MTNHIIVGTLVPDDPGCLAILQMLHFAQAKKVGADNERNQ